MFLCGGGSPYCTAVILLGETYGSGSTYAFTSYGCQADAPLTQIAYLSATATSTSSSTSSSSTATSTTSAPSSSIAASVLTVTASQTTATATNPVNTSQAPSPGLSEGAKIGLGAGLGVAGLLVFCGLGAWLFKRRRSRAVTQPAGSTLGPNDYRGTQSGLESKQAGNGNSTNQFADSPSQYDSHKQQGEPQRMRGELENTQKLRHELSAA